MYKSSNISPVDPGPYPVKEMGLEEILGRAASNLASAGSQVAECGNRFDHLRQEGEIARSMLLEAQARFNEALAEFNKVLADANLRPDLPSESRSYR